jgi:hypothetical protein
MSDAAQQRRAYGNTVVSIAKSREGIEQILVKWGVSGISWTDNFEKNQSVLRFAWKKDDSHFVARFMLQMETDEELYESAVDKRSSNKRVSEKKFKRLQQERGKREHRLLHMWLKDSMEAIEQGIISADQLFFAWIEDGQGVTLYERIEPVLGQLPSKNLPLALGASDGDG